MRNLSVLAALVVAGLTTSACDIKTSSSGDFSLSLAAGKAEDTWSRTYKLADKGRFELINVNGKITVEQATGSEVSVEGHRTAKANSDDAAKELLAKLEIREEAGDSSVRIESRPPRLSGMSGHEIEWTIKVPKGIVVDVRTTNGGVRMNDLANELHAKTTNGGVKGQGIDASVFEASAVNGGVDLDLRAPLEEGDSIDMETVNGGVTLGLPAESKATINARCVNGGVRADDLNIKKDQDASSSDYERKRRLSGTMNGGGGKVNLSTTNGGVRLSLAAGKKTT